MKLDQSGPQTVVFVQCCLRLSLINKHNYLKASGATHLIPIGKSLDTSEFCFNSGQEISRLYGLLQRRI